MGIWAGIKHALNSTLGTADFKPLDKMLAEQFRMNASDEVYATIWENYSVTTSVSGETIEKEVPQKIKMTKPGTAYFKGTFSRSWLSDLSGYFRIFKNGSLIFEEGGRWGQGNAEVTFSKKISFDVNDVFSFRFELYNASDNDRNMSSSVSNLTLNGSIVQNVFVEV